MDNNINNIQNAIVNAYNKGLLNGKTPEEAAQILYSYCNNLDVKFFPYYEQSMKDSCTLDISEPKTKDDLKKAMKQILRLDEQKASNRFGDPEKFD